MPFIGITAGKVWSDERWRYQCAEDYCRAVLEAGGWPLLLPAETIMAAGRDLLSACDGFLLSGGGDLDPILFGQEQHPASDDPDPARDRAELSLARLAVEAGYPLLAVCRGLQVLNVALGGDLIQDLASAGYPGHVQTQARTVRTHLVTPAAGTILAELLPGPTAVNSFHHQAIGRVAGPLAVAGHAPDGVIEAVCLPGQPVLGVQWHPESYAHLAPEGIRPFAWLVGEAGTRPR